MSESDTPLILEDFDDTPSTTTATPPSVSTPTEQTSMTIMPQKYEAKQLVVADRLSPDTIVAAKELSLVISSKNTTAAREISGKAMAPIEQNARALLNNVRMNDMDALGASASNIIDGIKILRLDDLKNEARGNVPAPVRKTIGSLFSAGKVAVSAIQGFNENRKQFLDVIDKELAKCRTSIADATTRKEILIQQSNTLKQSAREITKIILAYQYAIEREIAEYEDRRLSVIESQDVVEVQQLIFDYDRIIEMEKDAMMLKTALVQVANAIPTNNMSIKNTETIIQETDRVLRFYTPALLNSAAQVAMNAANRRGVDSIRKTKELSKIATDMAVTSTIEGAKEAQALSNDFDSAIADLERQTKATMEALHTIQDTEQQYREHRKTQEESLTKIQDYMINSTMSLRDKAVQRKLD